MSISQTIFRQYDVRGIVGRDLTEEVAYGLGRGYAAYLDARGIRGAVAVGRDNRPSGNALRDALVRGLTECGVDVVDIGVVPTPLLYWTLHHEPVVGGIQIDRPGTSGKRTRGHARMTVRLVQHGGHTVRSRPGEGDAGRIAAGADDSDRRLRSGQA